MHEDLRGTADPDRPERCPILCSVVLNSKTRGTWLAGAAAWAGSNCTACHSFVYSFCPLSFLSLLTKLFLSQPTSS